MLRDISSMIILKLQNFRKCFIVQIWIAVSILSSLQSHLTKIEKLGRYDSHGYNAESLLPLRYESNTPGPGFNFAQLTLGTLGVQSSRVIYVVNQYAGHTSIPLASGPPPAEICIKRRLGFEI